MGDRIVSSPLTVGHGNEDIRFVEDDDSSTDRHPSKLPDISVEEQGEVSQHGTERTSKEGSHAELSQTKARETKCLGVRQKEKTRVETTQKIRRSSDIIHSIFSRTPSFKKSRQEYEKVSTREDSTYSCIVESPSTKAPNETGRIGSYRLRSFAGGGSDIMSKRFDPKADDDEQALEMLRQVVRKCTNPDPMKRPSSKDVLDIVQHCSDRT